MHYETLLKSINSDTLQLNDESCTIRGFIQIPVVLFLLGFADETVTSPSAAPSSDATGAPKEYSFTFALQGNVESLHPEQSSLVSRVDGGTPNIMTLLSGNLVDVYTDGTTRIRYQNNTLHLNDLVTGSNINVKGNIVQNKLVAIEVLVQSVPSLNPSQSNPPIESVPGQNQRSGQEFSPQQPEQSQQPHQQFEASGGNADATQNQLPEQSQGRGNVRGITTGMPLWQQIYTRLVTLFRYIADH